jgi:hypothetical protein
METALAQELPYLRQELTRTVGLGDKVITSSGPRFCLIATQSIRGDRNDWNVREPWVGFDAARHRDAAADEIGRKRRRPIGLVLRAAVFRSPRSPGAKPAASASVPCRRARVMLLDQLSCSVRDGGRA